MLLFLFSLLWVLYSVCIFLFFFPSVRKRTRHIVLHECLYFNLFVACQNEDLEHVAGVVTRKREEKKTMKDSLCTVFVCDGEGLFIFGGVGGRGSGTKEEEKDAEYCFHREWKNIHMLPCVLPGPLYDVIAVPSLFLL